jgi:two-component system chemotaxis response regulator CheB
VTRVLIVDDSQVVREFLKDWISAEKDLQVVGEAKDGSEALDLVKRKSPDIVIMDVMMPKMSGLEATEKIMAYNPTPILIFSSVVNDKEMNIAFEAVSRGALDVMAKPGGGGKREKEVREDLIKKVRFLSRVPVIRHPLGKLKARKLVASAPVQREEPRKEIAEVADREITRHGILGIGASTGGPKALSDLLRVFPKNFPAPIVVVQHIADAFIEGLAKWLGGLAKLEVKVAAQGEELRAGKVYLAPAGRHMLVRNNRVELSAAPPVNNCKPAVDVLFNSLAEDYQEKMVAVLLTGMGNDGASGMKAIHEKGGRTIVQDQKSSTVFGMPGSAIELGAVDEVAALDDIPERIFHAFGFRDKEV